MKIIIFGEDYDLDSLEDIEKLSDVIEDSQVNSAKQVAHTLLTAILISSCED